jgi:lysozyme
MIQGVDLSDYEPIVDFVKVLSQGYKFAFIKACQGTWPENYYFDHMHNAKLAGIPRGVYHFYDPRYKLGNPKRQADFFWSMVKDDPGELPWVVDIEKYLGGYWPGWKNWYDFIERLKANDNTDHEIAIYTGFYYWRDEGGPAWWDTPRHLYFSQYPLWIARYGGPPLIPLTWTLKGWTFHQFYDNQVIDGVTGLNGRPTSIDVNYFNGDEAAFRARFKLDEPSDTPQPLPPQNEPVIRDGLVVATRGVRIRAFPSTSAGILGVLSYRTTVRILEDKVIQPGETWVRLRDANFGDQVWSAAIYNHQTLIQW